MLEVLRRFEPLPNPSSYAPTNCPEIYQQYLNYRVDPRTVVALHGLASVVFKPEVTFGDGVKDEVREWLDNDGALVMGMDHQFIMDHMVDAVAVRRDEVLKPFGETCRTIAKVEYFDTGEHPSLADIAISALYRAAGAVPAHRRAALRQMLKPDKDTPADPALVEEMIDLTAPALTTAMLDILKLKSGLLVYLEGGRKRGDWSTAAEVRDGVPIMLEQAAQEDFPVAVLIGGRSYGVKTESSMADINWRAPHIHFAKLEKGPFPDRERSKFILRQGMQRSIDTAHQYALGHR